MAGNIQGFDPIITPELQATICKDIREGVPAETAAECAGIHRGTYYNWMKHGRERDRQVYIDFLDAVVKAKAMAARERSVRAAQHATRGLEENGDWRATIEWLRRREPKLWEPPKAIEDLEDFTNRSPEDRATLAARYRSLLAALESTEEPAK